MRIKKGGPLDKRGIKLSPNLSAIARNNRRFGHGLGPNACWDQAFANWDELSKSKEPVEFKPIDPNDFPKIDLMTGESVKKKKIGVRKTKKCANSAQNKGRT